MATRPTLSWRYHDAQPERLALGVLAALCVAYLGLAAGLTPRLADGRTDGNLAAWAAHGLGTHEQLSRWLGDRFGPCAWRQQHGRPCPCCGMTTATALTVRGRFVTGLACQPFGALLAWLVAALALWAAVWATSGWRAVPSWPPLRARHLPPLIGALFWLSWLYKLTAARCLP